jgi:predicted transcriptional regulator
MKTLKVARMLVGVSATELASAAKVSVSELRRIELGLVAPRLATLARLDDAFMCLLRERHAAVGMVPSA